jgi:hypothetical protein
MSGVSGAARPARMSKTISQYSRASQAYSHQAESTHDAV